MRNLVNLNINISHNIRTTEYLYMYMPKLFPKGKSKLF